jgi:hypothetical protein
VYGEVDEGAVGHTAAAAAFGEAEDCGVAELLLGYVVDAVAGEGGVDVGVFGRGGGEDRVVE